MSGISDKKQEMMAQVVREAVFEAFMDILKNEGVESATMQLIAKKAGMSTGSLYNYFDNKEEIVGFIQQNMFEILYELATKAIETDDAIDRLKVLIERFCTFCAQYGLVFEDLKKHYPCKIEETSRDHQAKLAGIFGQAVSYGIKQKAFSPVDSVLAGKYILSLFIGGNQLIDSWFTSDITTDTNLVLTFILPYLKQEI
jgi:AcrR family transcriptional regulator